MKRILGMLLICCALGGISQSVEADATFTVDPGAPWVGFMNVFELPANGGGFAFNGAWATADLRANFSGPVLTLQPAQINTSDAFWYQGGTGGPGVPGNKSMDASMYQEQTGILNGQTITFTGNVLSNTLVSPYTSVAFIKDFAPDYSSSVSTTIALTPGVFSISLATDPDPARHIQFGFETIGPNVWPTDIDSFGNIQIAAVPEPASMVMGIAGLVGMVGMRGRRR
jgi:hypothetical protein